MTTYIVADSRGWFEGHPKSDKFESLSTVWISSKADLNLSFIESINPKYIFFPHWNWFVDKEIFQKYECIVFHTAPLPFGRGGSPIQNLIARKVYEAPVSALRMTDELDGGPIYDQIDVSLDGSIEDILARIVPIIETLILKIISTEPIPRPQAGEVVTFRRRTAVDSELSSKNDLTDFYDSIRMVDGWGYPKAYLKYGRFRLEFSNASIQNRTISATVTVTDDEDSNSY